MIEWLGYRAIIGYRYLTALATLSFQSCVELVAPARHGRAEAFRIIARQILFTGVDALPVTSVIALLFGIIIITQAGTQLPRLGAGGLVGNIIVLSVVRELGPLLTAFVVLGRSGTAIATELGNMSVTREIAALRLMGIPLSRFVIMPRLVGVIVSMICLTFYFDLVAILGGYLVAKVQLTVPFYAFIDGVISALGLSDVVLTVLKGTVFGAAVASVCCHHGLSVQSSFTEVPQQTMHAMINSVILCLLLDVCITIPVYL